MSDPMKFSSEVFEEREEYKRTIAALQRRNERLEKALRRIQIGACSAWVHERCTEALADQEKGNG